MKMDSSPIIAILRWSKYDFWLIWHSKGVESVLEYISDYDIVFMKCVNGDGWALAPSTTVKGPHG